MMKHKANPFNIYIFLSHEIAYFAGYNYVHIWPLYTCALAQYQLIYSSICDLEIQNIQLGQYLIGFHLVEFIEFNLTEN